MVRKHEIPETKKTGEKKPKGEVKGDAVIRGDARPEKKG